MFWHYFSDPGIVISNAWKELSGIFNKEGKKKETSAFDSI